MIYLLISIFSIIIGMVNAGFDTERIVVNFSPLLVLVVIAWITSRILFNTRVKSFYATENLEKARSSLDRTVKERTEELRKTNKKLLDEISERKRYARSLEQEKKKAQEADRLKSVFLANMSHEIRTPLNGIIGFTDLLKMKTLPEEKRKRYFEIISNNGQQLLKIIDDIMDISMIESNQLKMNSVPFRLSKVYPDVLEYFNNYKKLQDKDHIELISDGFAADCNDEILSDPSRIQQVLNNLMSNAIKFTEQGHVRFGGAYDSGFILTYVEDSGIGIPFELCSTIFERFRKGEESLSRSYSGTGLGLSICKGIIERLGGMIWLDYSYSQGARFCFSLPTTDISENYIPMDEKSETQLFTRSDLLISSTMQAKGSALKYYLACSKSEILTKSVNTFNLNDLGIEPGFVIIDLPNNAKKNLEICKLLNRELSRSKVISLINPDGENKDKLLDAGCSAVFQTPLNIQALLNYVHCSVMSLSQGK